MIKINEINCLGLGVLFVMFVGIICKKERMWESRKVSFGDEFVK